MSRKNFQHECLLKEISIPFGREFTCCDAVGRFSGIIRATFLSTEQQILVVVTDTTVSNQLIAFAAQVVEKVSKAYDKLLKCKTTCCIEAARALAFLAFKILSDTFFAAQPIQAGTFTATDFINIESARFTQFLQLIIKLFLCTCCSQRVDKRRNVVTGDQAGSLSTAPGQPNALALALALGTNTGDNTFGSTLLDQPDVRNIKTCCQALMGAISEYFATLATPSTLSTFTNLFTLEQIYTTLLRKISKEISPKCCIGVSEGLSALTQIAAFEIINGSSIINAVITTFAISGEALIQQIRRNQCDCS